MADMVTIIQKYKEILILIAFELKSIKDLTSLIVGSSNSILRTREKVERDAHEHLLRYQIPLLPKSENKNIFEDAG